MIFYLGQVSCTTTECLKNIYKSTSESYFFIYNKAVLQYVLISYRPAEPISLILSISPFAYHIIKSIKCYK